VDVRASALFATLPRDLGRSFTRKAHRSGSRKEGHFRHYRKTTAS